MSQIQSDIQDSLYVMRLPNTKTEELLPMTGERQTPASYHQQVKWYLPGFCLCFLLYFFFYPVYRSTNSCDGPPIPAPGEIPVRGDKLVSPKHFSTDVKSSKQAVLHAHTNFKKCTVRMDVVSVCLQTCISILDILITSANPDKKQQQNKFNVLMGKYSNMSAYHMELIYFPFQFLAVKYSLPYGSFHVCPRERWWIWCGSPGWCSEPRGFQLRHSTAPQEYLKTKKEKGPHTGNI